VTETIRSSVSGPRGELVVEREIIPVHYLSDIDADWRFTDAAGHLHHCDYAAADHYPTLRRVTDETWWCEDCRDKHETAHLECRRCGETVQPGVTGPGVTYVPGPATATLDGQPVSLERAEQIAAEWAGRLPGKAGG
jgi:hypothetical protein